MSLQRQLAEASARQVNRASVSANIVLIGGAIGTLALVFAVSGPWAALAGAGFGATLTAALYAATSALSAQAQIAVARHLDAALREESPEASAEPTDGPTP